MPLFSRIPRRQPHPPTVAGEVPSAAVISIADHALADIAAAARKSLRAAGVAIALESGGSFICRARAGEAAPELGIPVSAGQGITGECLAHGTAIACPDTDRDPRVNAEICRQLGIRSLLLVPLRRQGKVVGVLEALFATPNLFHERAVQLLESFADSVVSRAYPDDGLVTEDSEDAAAATPESRPEVSPEALHSARDAGVTPSAEPSATAATGKSLETALPTFAIAEPRPSLPYGIMLAVVVASTVLLVGAVALNRHARNAPVAAHKLTAGEPDAWVRLQKLAAGGDGAAQYYLGLAYKKGSGMPRDEAQAAQWLRRSAEQGNAAAQFELAEALENGRGVAPDRVEASAWYLVSGMQGDDQGEQAFERLTKDLSPAELGRLRRRIGEMHLEGKVVPRSLVSAYRWYALASAAGDPQAKALMVQLASKMTPQQLAEAKTRAAAWMKRHR